MENCRCGALLWLSNIGFAILSVITVFAWMGVSGFHESVTAQANAFPFHVYQHISGSLSAALAFAIIFLSGFNGTVTQQQQIQGRLIQIKSTLI